MTTNTFIPADLKRQLVDVRENSKHLHHLSLAEARRKFKPISHAVVTLATEVRGAGADQPFHQFFCPMVKQGEGDWLQSDDLLRNPYYGTEMLRCGELVRTIPPDAATAATPTETEHQHTGGGESARQEGK